MKCAYDLHIHSALSPCADDDMTPNNIAGMAAIKGLDIIALTDHNSCGNVRALMKTAQQYGITVIPGMEIESAEEVHIACYFPDILSAEEMQKCVKANMMGIKNDPKTFGNQYFMDEEDIIVGIEEELLVSATMLSFQEIFEKVRELGGFPVPAHIDRQSYSVISNLGFLPLDADIKIVEITPKALPEWREKYSDYGILSNSDAHNLGNIAEKERYIDILGKSTKDVMDYFVQYFSE